MVLLKLIFSLVSQITIQDSVFCLTNFYRVELGNKTTISNLSVQQSNYHPLVAVDDPLNYCPRPSVLDNSSSGQPQHPRGDSFDCCTERYEIVVYCTNGLPLSILHVLSHLSTSLIKAVLEE